MRFPREPCSVQSSASALGTKTGGLASAEWVSGRHEGKPSRLNGRLTLPDWLSVASSAGTREGKDGHVLVVGHAVGGKLRGPRTKAVAGIASSKDCNCRSSAAIAARQLEARLQPHS